MILWALLLPHRIQFHRINRKIAHVAKDGPSLAAALSASSGSGPLPNEAAVLLAVSDARGAACPLEVGRTTWLCNDFFLFSSRACVCRTR